MSRELLERYWQVIVANDRAAMAPLRHAEWTTEWPQSGERIPSHEHDRAIHEHYPGYPRHELLRIAGRDEEWTVSPMLVPIRVRGSGDLWVGEARLHYPDGETVYAIALFDLRDGLVWKDTEYFAAPFDPPEWRAAWVDSIPAAEVAGGRIQTIVGTPVDEEHHRQAVRRWREAVEMGEVVAALRDLYHEDVVEDWPQSGERIRGVENAVAIVERHPDYPRADVRRIAGSGDLWILEAKLEYAEGVWWQASLMEFRGDKVARTTDYFARAFDPPEWRRQWVELM